MRAFGNRLLSSPLVAVLVVVLTSLALHEHASAQMAKAVIPQLEEHLGLTEFQARGALGALLVYARENLPKPEFDQLASRIPNAETIMEDVKIRGIVTRPLDTISDYEESLASLGIGQPLASQIAPAVLDYLEEAGYDREHDILVGIMR